MKKKKTRPGRGWEGGVERPFFSMRQHAWKLEFKISVHLKKMSNVILRKKVDHVVSCNSFLFFIFLSFFLSFFLFFCLSFFFHSFFIYFLISFFLPIFFFLFFLSFFLFYVFFIHSSDIFLLYLSFSLWSENKMQ